MKKLLINSISLSLSLMFASICYADNSANKNEVNTNKVAEPVMQAGGYSNINNAKLQELLD